MYDGVVGMEFQTIPIMRIFDEDKAKKFSYFSCYGISDLDGSKNLNFSTIIKFIWVWRGRNSDIISAFCGR
jgi:hypothetical protein